MSESEIIQFAAEVGQLDQVRTPPVNVQAEMALLGAILANNLAYEKVSDFLLPEHFSNPVHGKIYESVGKLVNKGQVADAVQLRYLFENEAALDDIGGGRYLAELQANVVSIINAADYGRTIFDLANRRQLIGIGEDMVNDAHDPSLDNPAVEQIERAEGRLYALAETGDADVGLKSFAQSLTGAVEMAESAFKRDGQLVGVNTGLTKLNEKLGGLHQSDLLILAGRPAMGKTGLATSIAVNAAKKDNAKVAFFSLEMSAEQLATRIVSGETNISSDRIRKGEISQDQMENLIRVAGEIEEMGLFIDDTPAITVPTMRSRARRLKRQHGLDLIVVDYLQLMRGLGQENRVQEISEITRGLKAIAKELEVPVLALSQLSRAVEQREDKKPMLSDLRESGSIEQDADVVMFVYRPEYYIEKTRPMPGVSGDDDGYGQKLAEWQARMEQVYNRAVVIIGKQRHGPVGEVDLFFDGPTTAFSDLVEDSYLPEQRV